MRGDILTSAQLRLPVRAVVDDLVGRTWPHAMRHRQHQMRAQSTFRCRNCHASRDGDAERAMPSADARAPTNGCLAGELANSAGQPIIPVKFLITQK